MKGKMVRVMGDPPGRLRFMSDADMRGQTIFLVAITVVFPVVAIIAMAVLS